MVGRHRHGHPPPEFLVAEHYRCQAYDPACIMGVKLPNRVTDAPVARGSRVALAAAGLVLAATTLVIWWTTNTLVAHGPLTSSSIEFVVWHGVEIHPYLLAAAWWLAFLLIAAATFGKWSLGALGRTGALLLVFGIIAFAVPPPIHPPSLGGPTSPLSASPTPVVSRPSHS